MSILNRMKIQRETVREATTEVKLRDLARGAQEQVEQAGLALIKNEASEPRHAGHSGEIVKPQEQTTQAPTPGCRPWTS